MSRIPAWVVLLGPAALALGLRLFQIGHEALWLDEIITHDRAALPAGDLVANAFANRHLPTYFLLVKPFNAAVIDEALLRLPSALAGSVSVLLVGLIATRAWSLTAGVTAALLMALAPIEVRFGQEARSYALNTALILLALWGLTGIARQSGRPDGRPDGEPPRLAPWLLYAAGTLGTLYVLVAGAMWLAASQVALAVMAWHAGPARPWFVRRWVATAGMILVLWLPALVGLLTAMDIADPLRGYHWIPPSTLDHVGRVLATVYLFRIGDVTTLDLLPTPLPGFGLVVLAAAAYGGWRLRSRPLLLAAIGLAAVAMPLALALLTPVAKLWIPRYLAWSLGPVLVLAGIGIAALPRLPRVTAAAVSVAALIVLTPYYRLETKPHWDKAAAWLAARVQPGDVVVTNDWAALYVLRSYGRRYELDDAGAELTPNSRTLAPAREPEATLWVVWGRTGQGVMAPAARALAKWQPLGPPDETVRFGRNITLLRFASARETRPPLFEDDGQHPVD